MSIAPVVISQSKADAADGTASETTITIGGSSYSSTATANLKVTDPTAGTFIESSDTEKAKFGVKTTNYTGYTLTISSSDDDGKLIDSSTGNYFSTIDKAIDKDTFDNSTYNGKWGYKYSKINTTSDKDLIDNNYFWPSPTKTATTLDKTDSANITDNEYTLGLGVRADATLAAGAYTHAFNISATANPVTYTISYEDSTSDSTVTNLPDGTLSGSTNTTTATSIPISSVTPSRTGFKFVGWCNKAPTIDATTKTATCPGGGETYNVGDTYPINQTTVNNIVLYATWEVSTYDITIKPTAGISSVSLNGTSCSDKDTGCIVNDLTYGQTYTLIATVDTTSGYTFGAWSNVGAGTIGTGADSDIKSSSTTFTIGEGDSIIYATTTGGTYNLTVYFPATGVKSINIRTAEGKDGGSSVKTLTATGNVDIIPGEIYYLYPTFADGYYLSSWSKAGAYGNLSCSLNGSCYTAYNPFFISGDGNGVVGIAVQTMTMQSFTHDQCMGMPVGATVTLNDTRDTHSYRIRKLPDGNCWMIDNLLFGYNASNPSSYTLTLKATDSNVVEDTTLTAYDLPTHIKGDEQCKGSYNWGTFVGEGNGYSSACLNSGTVNSSDVLTVWYNYYAASAGTVSGSSSDSDASRFFNASYSICSKGWRLPSIAEALPLASYVEQFEPVAGGFYDNTVNTAIMYLSHGYFWMSDNSGDYVSRSLLGYKSGGLFGSSFPRARGAYVRCIKST